MTPEQQEIAARRRMLRDKLNSEEISLLDIADVTFGVMVEQTLQKMFIDPEAMVVVNQVARQLNDYLPHRKIEKRIDYAPAGDALAFETMFLAGQANRLFPEKPTDLTIELLNKATLGIDSKTFHALANEIYKAYNKFYNGVVAREPDMWVNPNGLDKAITLLMLEKYPPMEKLTPPHRAGLLLNVIETIEMNLDKFMEPHLVKR